MGPRVALLAAAVSLAASACTTGASAPGRRATATLTDASGREVAVVRLTETGAGGVLIAGDFRGLSAGSHGIHVHAVGRCDAADAYASAGGHFNPASRKHGLESADGAHAGDLPNLVIAANGAGSLRTVSTRVSLGGGEGSLLDADGSALVVHAGPDDQRTDPSGGSGARVACGVIRAD